MTNYFIMRKHQKTQLNTDKTFCPKGRISADSESESWTISEGIKGQPAPFYRRARSSADKAQSRKQKDKNTHRPWGKCRYEKMTDGQGISFKDIRKGHRHAVSKCQRGEEERRWAVVQWDMYRMASRLLLDTVFHHCCTGLHLLFHIPAGLNFQ